MKSSDIIKLVFFYLWIKFIHSQATDEATKQQIRDAVKGMLPCRHVPGMSLAVVKHGQVWMTEGFGKRDLDRDLDADSDTKFCIGSLTKAFTSALIAKLISENKEPDRTPIHWESSVRSILGYGFDFGDEVRNELTTVKDLLAHKMGFPSYRGAWLYGLDLSHPRIEYCRRLQQLTPIYTFREKFTYNNFMYMLVGCMAEEVTKNKGLDIKQLLEQELLGPIRLNDTVFPGEDTDWLSEYALPYVWVDGQEKHQQLDLRFAQNIYPSECAGALCSPPADMARWIKFLLQHGKIDGKQIIKEHILYKVVEATSTRRGRTIRKPEFPFHESHPNYGMGWSIGTYKGYRSFQHSGGISGYTSLLTLLPDLHSGIYTSTNGPMHQNSLYANKVVHYYISDLLMGNSATLNSSTLCTFPAPWTPQRRIRFRKDPRESSWNKTTSSNEWFSPYTGNYGHLLLGNVSIYHNQSDDRLHFRIGRYAQGWLEPDESENSFKEQFYGPLWYLYNTGPFRGMKPVMRFLELVDGTYQKLEDEGYEPAAPPVFTRGLQWIDLPPNKANSMATNYSCIISFIVLILVYQ